jgi:transcriptional regulator
MTDSNLTPLFRGTVDLLILRSLTQGPSHGYEISRWVRERTDDVLTLEDAPLYQALHRLEDEGLITSEWGVSENNRRAKYYELTAEGRRRLRQEIAGWKRYAAAVFKIVEAAGALDFDGDSAVPTRITLAMRSGADVRALGEAIRAETRRIDPGAMVSYVRTLDRQLDAALVRERPLAVLLLSSGISVLALLQACVGPYGTLSYNVVQRAREIGVRMALGAARTTVQRQILRQSLTIAISGMVVGGVASLWVSRALSAFLFELSPRDPATLTAVIALLLVTACAAGYVPAHRATSVDPARVLKAELHRAAPACDGPSRSAPYSSAGRAGRRVWTSPPPLSRLDTCRLAPESTVRRFAGGIQVTCPWH